MYELNSSVLVDYCTAPIHDRSGTRSRVIRSTIKLGRVSVSDPPFGTIKYVNGKWPNDKRRNVLDSEGVNREPITGCTHKVPSGIEGRDP